MWKKINSTGKRGGDWGRPYLFKTIKALSFVESCKFEAKLKINIHNIYYIFTKISPISLDDDSK